MRKVIVTEFVSLDGVMQDPQNWSFPYWTDEIGNFKQAELFASDAQLLGRVTYEGFAAAWPERTDEAGYADRLNSLPKYVVTTTLKKADWNNSHIIKDNVADAIAKLKQQEGQNILVHGSRTLVQTLVQNDLVDQYNLLVYPDVLGEGMRLFDEGLKVNLKLVETKTYSSGVVALIYQTDKKDA